MYHRFEKEVKNRFVRYYTRQELLITGVIMDIVNGKTLYLDGEERHHLHVVSLR